EHVIENHGPLGTLYPQLAFIMEGDTPSFLGLIDNGLGWSVSPAYGGWGGRYTLMQPPGEPRPIWTNDGVRTADAVLLDGEMVKSDQATIWRYREQFQHDFAARMNWCVADSYAKANHNPVAVLNGDRTKRVLTLHARPGSTVSLSSAGSSDPDRNTARATWWIYNEAGTLGVPATLGDTAGASTTVKIPETRTPGTVHVILQVEDDGEPRLVSYRRAVIEVRP
ncbi:MAG TPA: nucleoside hydrolase-like domain-containing protein, partial [Gemmatimonadaceae bacterium]|nr:nucleoside hydrolase-like domain-containing protein [Gemmatimonadaceae bacterium]